MAGATWNYCRLGASSVYTIQPCTSLQCHFIQSHIGRVYVCLAVTCHLHFWQNDLDILRATAVTLGWNVYRNKSQHSNLTLEKKILPPLQSGEFPEPFDHESDVLTTELSPLPESGCMGDAIFWLIELCSVVPSCFHPFPRLLLHEYHPHPHPERIQNKHTNNNKNKTKQKQTNKQKTKQQQQPQTNKQKQEEVPKPLFKASFYLLWQSFSFANS